MSNGPRRRLADPVGTGLPALPLGFILRQSILGGERQSDPVKGVDNILIQRAQFFTVGDGAGELRFPVDKQHADFFPWRRAACAVKCSITVESFPPEKDTQMREKLSMTHWIRCSVACSTDSGKGYLVKDMTINPLIVEIPIFSV